MLASTDENVAVFLHLLGAFVLVGGTVLAGVAFESARRRGAVSEIALLLSLARIAVALVGAGALVALIFGLWLVHIDHVGYGAGWVDGAIGLFVVMMALGAIGGQAPKRARRLAESGADPEAVRAILDDVRVRATNALAALALLAIIALMVFRPGGSAS